MILLHPIGLLSLCLLLNACQTPEATISTEQAVRIVEAMPQTIAYASRINSPLMILEDERNSAGVTLAVGEDRGTHFTRGMTIRVDPQQNVFLLEQTDDKAGYRWRLVWCNE